MTDITAFPTATKRILVHGDNSYTFTVGSEAIKAGQVVGIASNGGDFTITPCNSADAVCPIGIADHAASSTETLTVHMYGTVCKVFNEDDTTAIEAGTELKQGTVDGAVCAATPGGATEYLVGIALEDIPATAAGSYGGGNALICPHINTIA